MNWRSCGQLVHIALKCPEVTLCKFSDPELSVGPIFRPNPYHGENFDLEPNPQPNPTQLTPWSSVSMHSVNVKFIIFGLLPFRTHDSTQPTKNIKFRPNPTHGLAQPMDNSAQSPLWWGYWTYPQTLLPDSSVRNPHFAAVCLSRSVASMVTLYVYMWQLFLIVNPLKPNSSNYYTLAYRLNLPFLCCDIRALWRSALSARMPECQKLIKVG